MNLQNLVLHATMLFSLSLTCLLTFSLVILRMEIHVDVHALQINHTAISQFRIQYKTSIAEVCDYFQNSTLEEVAHWK